jgi:hypothetical protein
MCERLRVSRRWTDRCGLGLQSERFQDNLEYKARLVLPDNAIRRIINGNPLCQRAFDLAQPARETKGGNMPLLDHFRPPLVLRRHWHSFHNAWATYIASDLNRRLPDGYFAEPNVQFGIEIDVAAFNEAEFKPNMVWPTGSVQTVWTAPAPILTIPLPIITDVVEVLVFDREGGPTLAGAIELLSPSNKDRPTSRDALVTKCAAYSQQGVGLVVVDVVTDRHSHCHDEILKRLGWTKEMTLDTDLSTAAYRPVDRSGQTSLDIWQESLGLGLVLPTMALWLRGNLCLPVDLEATYDRTCREHRITA